MQFFCFKGGFSTTRSRGIYKLKWCTFPHDGFHHWITTNFCLFQPCAGRACSKGCWVQTCEHTPRLNRPLRFLILTLSEQTSGQPGAKWPFIVRCHPCRSRGPTVLLKSAPRVFPCLFASIISWCCAFLMDIRRISCSELGFWLDKISSVGYDPIWNWIKMIILTIIKSDLVKKKRLSHWYHSSIRAVPDTAGIFGTWMHNTCVSTCVKMYSDKWAGDKSYLEMSVPFGTECSCINNSGMYFYCCLDWLFC